MLAIALGEWEQRDDSKADPDTRRAANTAMDEIDAMLADLNAAAAWCQVNLDRHGGVAPSTFCRYIATLSDVAGQRKRPSRHPGPVMTRGSPGCGEDYLPPPTAARRCRTRSAPSRARLDRNLLAFAAIESASSRVRAGDFPTWAFCAAGPARRLRLVGRLHQ